MQLLMRLLKYLTPGATEVDGTKEYKQFTIKRTYTAGKLAGAFLLIMAVLTFVFDASGNIVNYVVGTALFLAAIPLFRFNRTYNDKSQQTLDEATSRPPEINPFNVAHPVKRGVFGIPTVLSSDETIIAQPAPISIGGWEATSLGSTTGGETNNQSVNTFMCTNYQIICVLLGYDDAPSGIDIGSTNSFDETIRNFQFTYFNKKNWKAIADNSLAQGLSNLIEHHFSYSFPYSNIKTIEPATHQLLNHSLDITLTDGKTISYTFQNPEERIDIINKLKDHVTIIEK